MSSALAVQELDAMDSEYAVDSWSWKEDQFKTFDEHDPDDAIKPFPTEKPYLRALHDVWQTFRFTLEEKSRQMMRTWSAVGDHLHLAQYTPRRRILLNSMDEDAALELLDRLWFSYEEQEDWVKDRHPAKKVGNKIRWLDNGSVAIAVPKGKHKSRSLVCSAFLFDEMGFNDLAEHLFMGSIPGLVAVGRRGGRFTGISTAYPSYFEKRIAALKNNSSDEVELLPGLSVWRGGALDEAAGGHSFTALRLHYSCDTDPYLAAKVAQARASYEKLGMLAWFEREYEIQYDSLSGEFIWPTLSKETHGIAEFLIPPDWKRVQIIDNGYHNAAVLWVAVSPPGWNGCVDEDGTAIPVLVVYDAMQKSKMTPRQLYQVMQERHGNEHFGLSLIDPSSDIHRGDGEGGKSIFGQFKELGIRNLVKADNAVAAGLTEVRTRLCVYGKSPALLAFNGLKLFWDKCTKYRYKDDGDRVVRDLSEDAVRKVDDHVPDCLRYVCQFRPMPAKSLKRKVIPGSWMQVWRELKKSNRRKTLNRALLGRTLTGGDRGRGGRLVFGR